MTSPPKINCFNELIEPHLNGAKVQSYKTRFLTKLGDNYGSTMLAVTVFLEQPNGSTSQIELVTKSPPTVEYFWKLFQPEITCRKENGCYTDISPALIKLQREANIPEEQINNVFPKCYGARLSLKGDSKVDYDALLILENLINNGYKLGDRLKGFDFDQTQLILKDLAKFHATVIGERVLKPKEFDEKFRPHLKKFHIESFFQASTREGLRDATIEDMKKMFPGNTKLCEKFTKGIDLYDQYIHSKASVQDGLFTTLGHFDFWVNNMLIQYDLNGKPNNCKIVDYQEAQYDSFAHDLIFFLFTSVEIVLLKEKIDEFTQHYYVQFIAQLKLLGVSTAKYTVEEYMKEINRIAPYQLGHIMMMLKVLLANMDNVKELSEVNEDLFTEHGYLDETFYNRVKDVVILYDKKQWLP